MKKCNLEPVFECVACDHDYKSALLSIPILKEDCKDEMAFVKRLIRENRLVKIEGNFIHTPFVIDYYTEIIVTYKSRDDRTRTLTF